MTRRTAVVLGGSLGAGFLLASTGLASAGGLFLPGSGAVSTSRAGAAIVSADDGEALSLNPAGLAKARGTTITISAAIISYAMEFTRTGSYDAIDDAELPYEGSTYPTIKNKADAPFGIGSFQPVPVVAVVTDLGGRLDNVRLALGLYAPNAYPFRDMSNGYQFNGDPNAPPPPTRYDIYKQEGAILLPSLGVSYRVLPQLDVGVRASAGFAHVKSVVGLWSSTNRPEDVSHDTLFTADATDRFVPAFGVGVTYRPHPNIEVSAVYNSALNIHGKGNATAINGPAVELSGNPITIGPSIDSLCAPGGTFAEQKACVDLQIPQSAAIGARYLFRRADGSMAGDLELNVGWENWGKRCDIVGADFDNADCTSPGQYRVVVDAAPYIDTNNDGMNSDDEALFPLATSFVDHRMKDTYSVRLGGSYLIPLDPAKTIVVRGGVGYDTRAAEEGWLRADLDGAARVTTAVGAAYRTDRIEINAGVGAILEGSNTNAGNCNPVGGSGGCGPNGDEQDLDDRSGPDPINPILTVNSQVENPITQGTIKSHYLMFMLGVTTWF